MIPAPVEVEETVRTVVTRYKASNGQTFVHRKEAVRWEAITYLTHIVDGWHRAGWLKCHPMEIMDSLINNSTDLAECFDILGDD